MEIIEIKLSLTKENKDFRIDSQFHTQEPVKNPKLHYKKIRDVIDKAQYGISVAMNEDGIGHPIYRMNEIHHMLCDQEVSKFANISQDDLENFTLNDRDVVFNRTNSIEWVGRTGLYRKADKRNFVFASYLVKFVPNKKIILPEFLTCFLNSKYGVSDIKRRARHSVNQANVNPEEVKAMNIPMLSMDFQNRLKVAFDNAYLNSVESKILYEDAENLLLNNLGLKPTVFEGETANIKNLSESFGETGRLDAEYYQPKYDDLISKLKLLNYAKLNSLVSIKKSIEPGSNVYQETGIPFMRVSNITKLELTDPDIHLSPSLFDKDTLIDLMPKKDTILMSKDGTVGISYKIKKDMRTITCGALLHLTIKDNSIVLPEYLTLVLNSFVVQLQAERDAGGSIIQHWKPSEIQELIIPIIDYEMQQHIEAKINESFLLQAESKCLLEIAKKAVELAIEKDEKIATQYIEENTNLGMN